MRTAIRCALPVAAVGVLALAAPAGASALSCGATVHKNVTLKSNLDCSSGGSGGLIVGRDGITVDLNGHSITGAGGLDGYEGIENEGYDNVTIENGTVKGFQDDVFLSNAARNTVKGMDLRNNGLGFYNGIYSTSGTGNHFTDNHIKYSRYGIYMDKGGGNRVLGNVFKDAANGVYTTIETHDNISHNTSKGFSILTYAFNSQHDVSQRYRQDVASGGYIGFYIYDPVKVLVDKATATENGYAGVDVEANKAGGVLVQNSTASNNDEYGMYAANAIPSRHNVALGNDFFNCYLVNCNGGS